LTRTPRRASIRDRLQQTAVRASSDAPATLALVRPDSLRPGAHAGTPSEKKQDASNGRLRLDGRAREVFEASFAAGGGASFWVNHSHQTVLDGDDLTDYCRGWLNLRRGYVEFAPEEGDHGFRLTYAEVAEFKQNRNKAFFHIKRGGKNQNFRPRSADQRETLLLLILFNKFSR